jgi:hypothetical protein
MIHPLVSLAFSVYSKKGAYALMLSSGVSRAAGIPCGSFPQAFSANGAPSYQPGATPQEPGSQTSLGLKARFIVCGRGCSWPAPSALGLVWGDAISWGAAPGWYGLGRWPRDGNALPALAEPRDNSRGELPRAAESDSAPTRTFQFSCKLL